MIKKVILLFVFLLWNCENSTGPKLIKDRKAAPDFTLNSVTLTNTNNGEISLSDYQGKVVFLFFLGYNCPPCINAAPKTRDINNGYSKEEVRVVGLDAWDGSLSGAADFVVRTGVEYPVCIDAGSVASKYKVNQEYAVIIDKEGLIAYKKSGIDQKDIKNTIDTLLEE